MSSRSLVTHQFGLDTGPRALWVHGWLGQGGEGAFLPSLLGEVYQWQCPDLPGHGETAIADWQLVPLLKALAEQAESCETVVGYSLGGRLLMMAAARYPECFSSMVIESSHPGLPQLQDRLDRKLLDQQRASELCGKGLHSFCQQWYQAPMWGGLPFPERRGDPMELAEALKRFSLSKQPDLRPWLRTARNPLLWLAGTRDRVYGSFAHWCSDHTTHRVEMLDAGHNIHAQCPQEWATCVNDFLRT